MPAPALSLTLLAVVFIFTMAQCYGSKGKKKPTRPEVAAPPVPSHVNPQPKPDSNDTSEEERHKMGERIRNELQLLDDAVKEKCPLIIQLANDTIHKLENGEIDDPEYLNLAEADVQVVKKVLIPDPLFKGKILGRGGGNVKQLSTTYHCNLKLYGRGATKDPDGEAALIGQDPEQYRHLTGPLHLRIQTSGTRATVNDRVNGVLQYLSELFTNGHQEQSGHEMVRTRRSSSFNASYTMPASTGLTSTPGYSGYLPPQPQFSQPPPTMTTSGQQSLDPYYTSPRMSTPIAQQQSLATSYYGVPPVYTESPCYPPSSSGHGRGGGGMGHQAARGGGSQQRNLQGGIQKRGRGDYSNQFQTQQVTLGSGGRGSAHQQVGLSAPHDPSSCDGYGGVLASGSQMRGSYRGGAPRYPSSHGGYTGGDSSTIYNMGVGGAGGAGGIDGGGYRGP